MKKQVKRLALSRETVRRLSAPDLEKVRGGADTLSVEWYCFGTWICTTMRPRVPEG